MYRSAFFILALVSLWVACRQNIELPSSDNLPMPAGSWQEIAAEKRLQTRDRILRDPVLAQGKSRRSIAGSFIEGLLDLRTLFLTSLDPVDIVACVGNGSVFAVEMTTAFCKRASFAHHW